MAQLLGKCPKCGGNIFLDGDIKKCLQCGLEIQGRVYTEAYYEQNIAEIIKDYNSLGRPRLIKKWHIPSGSFSKLRKRAVAKALLASRPAPVPQAGNHLPELPVFSSDWAPEVQLKWLEIWAEKSKL